MENKTPVQQSQTEGTKEKTKSKWWVWLIVIVVVIILGIIAVAFFALQKARDFIEEQDLSPDTVINQMEEGLTIEEDEFTTSPEEQYVTWASLGIPSTIPEYTDGNIQKPILDFTWTTGGVPNFVTVYNTSEEAIEEYVQNAIDNGWTLLWERGQEGDEDLSWALSYGENEYGILLNWYGVSSDYLSILLTEGSPSM